MSAGKVSISIGMPVFNGGKFISEAIESLLNQSYRDFELIISDNASTDNTEIICRNYALKDSRIRYIRQETNLGAVANFKFVFELSNAKYFMWAAADDVWDLQWIESLLPLSQRFQCLSFGTVQTIDEHGNNIRHAANMRNFTFSGSYYGRRFLYWFEPEFMGKANTIYGIYPKKNINKEVFNELIIGQSGDIFFLFNYLKKANIRSSKSVKLFKRVHESCAGGGISKISRKKTFLSFYYLFITEIRNSIYKFNSFSFRADLFEKIIYLISSPIMTINNLNLTIYFKYFKK